MHAVVNSCVCLSFLAVKYNVTDQQLTMITDEHINAVSLFLPKWEQVANQLGVDRLQIDGITQAPGINIVVQNHRELLQHGRMQNILEKLKEVGSAYQVCELIH